MITAYRGYMIEPGPSYTKDSRFQFTHVEYDGPEDRRHGIGESVADCMQQIDEIEEDAA